MLKLAVMLFLLLLVLSFFGISLQHLVESPVAQENFHYVGSLFSQAWHDVIDAVLGFTSRFI
jgi:hypothetical protein